MTDERNDDLLDESALFDVTPDAAPAFEPEAFEQEGPDLFAVADEPPAGAHEPPATAPPSVAARVSADRVGDQASPRPPSGRGRAAGKKRAAGGTAAADGTAPAENPGSAECSAPAESSARAENAGSAESSAPVENPGPAESSAPAENPGPAESSAPAENLVVVGSASTDGSAFAESPAPADNPDVDSSAAADTDTAAHNAADGGSPTSSDSPASAHNPADADSPASSDELPVDAAADALAATRRPEPDAAAMHRPEAPLALYRRYRPDTFADVIGQEHVTEPLQRALTNNRVNHAYLFSGPRGCGKTTSARILARALNCAKGPSPVPCGECQSCRDLARGGAGSIDVIEIDAASHGGVDDARDLRERAFFAPVSSRYKIYIVDEAHMVTTAGFNALLKVVEEPPPHVKFIFATTEPEKVIGTIRSRTHHYPFRLVPPKTLSAYLASLCEAEGVSVDVAALPLVVRAGAGSVRDSLSVLDQLLGGAGEGGVTYTQAAALLGYTPDALLDEIVDAFAAGDAHAVFAAIDKVIEVGQDPRRFAEDLLRRLRDLIIVAAVPDALSTGLVNVAADQAERLRGQAGALGAGELTRAAEVLAVGLTEMRGTTAPRLHLELMCARVLLPAADANDRGVHARLDRLERRLQMTSPEALATQTESLGATPAQDAHRDHSEPHPKATGERGYRPDASTPPGSADPVSASGSPGEPSGARQGVSRQPAATTRADASARADASVRADASARADASTRADGSTRADVSTSGGRSEPAAQPGPAAWPERSQPAQPERSQFAPAEQPARSEPGPNPSAPGDLARSGAPTQPSDAPAATSQVPGGAALTTVDFRRLWPEILDEVKNRRRFTWILLSQHAHVVDVVDGVLSLGLNNTGARDSFGRGGSDDVLREAILQVTATPVKIQVVIDSTGADEPAPQAGAAPSNPNPVPAKRPAEPPRAQRPAAVDQARQNIRATSTHREPPPPEEEPSRDDVSLEDESVNHDELLAKHLGAELIAEED